MICDTRRRQCTRDDRRTCEVLSNRPIWIFARDGTHHLAFELGDLVEDLPAIWRCVDDVILNLGAALGQGPAQCGKSCL